MISEPQRTAVPSPRLPLDVLSHRMRVAREAVHQRRQGHAASPELASARHGLVIALDDYIAALEKRHLPVPNTLRAELRLHKQLLDW